MENIFKLCAKRLFTLRQRDAIRMVFSRIKKLLHTYLYQVRDILLSIFNASAFIAIDEKISIIIPTLSKGEHVDHLPKLKKLLSIYLPSQSYKNYEVLVYCDGLNEAVKDMVKSLNDNRIKIYLPENTTGKWGNQRIRMGISGATGSPCVILNDDYKPYKSYLQALINGFDQDTGIVYGRVIFKGEARERHFSNLKNSYVIPNDKKGDLRLTNLDMCCCMVRMSLAKRYVDFLDDSNSGDWNFIEALLKSGVKARFVDKIIGDKF